MAFLNKLMETANTVKDKATNFAEEKQLAEKLGNVKESVKKTWDENTSAIKENSKENKELKQALDGAIKRYEVIYISGLPEYPKVKHGNAIGMNIMPDRFIFTKTSTSKDWFKGYEITYESILDLKIEKRTISTAEILLGAGDSANQQQENVICIIFTSDEGIELTLRVEMLTGVTIFNQAAKCREFMDILRQNRILKMIQGKAETETGNAKDGSGTIDVFEQLEKLASLKEKGILSDEEFQKKKEELLAKI